jgi:DNA polymerase-3 subunit epsilon
MSNWHAGPVTGFDLETTGPEPEAARVVTAAVVRRRAELPDRDFCWLADPGCEIPDEAAAIHGVTTERARAEGRPAREVVSEVIAALRVATGPVVIFNAAYDLTVLHCEASRLGVLPLDLAGKLIVDPHVLDKMMDRYRRGSRTLTATCEHYGVKLDDAHQAEADALAAMRLAWKLASKYPKLAGQSASALMAMQSRARRAQAAGLEAYFAKIGKPEKVNGDWPVRRVG